MKQKLYVLILIAILATVMYFVSGYPKSEPTPTIIPTETVVVPTKKPRIVYECPANEWVDCMPGPDKRNSECTAQYLNWAKANCPNFKGAAY